MKKFGHLFFFLLFYLVNQPVTETNCFSFLRNWSALLGCWCVCPAHQAGDAAGQVTKEKTQRLDHQKMASEENFG